MDEYHEIFEAIPDGITVHDATDGSILDANQTFCEMFGYTREELLELDFEALHVDKPPYTSERAGQYIQKAATEGPQTFEWRDETKDGEVVPVEVHLRQTAIGDDQRILAVVRDITDRNEGERELERTRDLLQYTERIADVGGWEINPETQDVFWSDHLFEMLEWEDGEEPPLEDALDVYLEEDRPGVEKAVEDALMTGESFAVEARFQRPDGEIRWFDIRGKPTIENDEVVTVRGAVHDITDRRRRERILREMHDIISNRHRSFEEQVQALLELGRTELGTKYGTLSEIRGEEYIFEFVVSDDDSIQPGDVVPVSATNCEIVASTEQTLVLGDVERDAPEETERAGFTEWGISCYIGAPVFVENEVYGTFCFYGTEARSDQFSDWEEMLVDLMSSWVSYEIQRRQVNERLLKQNEQLEQFASIVSHDLRNPLNVAQGRLELAREEHDNEHLEVVARSHKRMNDLIDDLLELARAGDIVSETKMIDLADSVADSWRNVDTAEAEIRVNTTQTISADRGRLQQLLENLLRNAVEHGDPGVWVTVGHLDHGFYVEDNGDGIPEDEREDVFEAGYTTSEQGTGFGLNIVKQIVDAHGWEMRVTEGSEGGARFEITGVEFVAT